MPRVEGEKNYIPLNRGIITEAPSTGFPEGASLDEQNFAFVKGSTVRRRRPPVKLAAPATYSLGDMEVNAGIVPPKSGSGLVNYDPARDGHLIGYSFWPNASGTGRDFHCFAYGHTLYLIEESLDPNGIESRTLQVDIPFDADSEVVGKPQMAVVAGALYIVAPHLKYCYVKLDENGDPVVVELRAKERDLAIMPEPGLAVSDRPATLTPERYYNLRNMGWFRQEPNSGALLYALYQNQTGVYPSLTENPNTGYYTNPSTGKRAWDAKQVQSFSSDSGLAPRGSIIRRIFDNTSTSVNDPIDQYTIINVEFIDMSVGLVYVQVDRALTSFVSGQTFDISKLVIEITETYTEQEPGSTFTFTRTYTRDYAGVYTGYTVPGNPPDKFGIYLPEKYQNTSDTTYSFAFVEGGTATQYETYNTTENPELNLTVPRTNFHTIASFAGRVWIANNTAPRLAGRVYYSRVIEDPSHAEEFYQENDPTSPDISDLLPTDGGYIRIAGAGKVVALREFNESLYVFCDNGVWRVGPGERGFFAADSYSVTKVTDYRIASPDSIVVLEEGFLFWADSGIVAFQLNNISGQLEPAQATKSTIQTLYDSIPLSAKRKAVGVRDDANRQVFWYYESADDTGQHKGFTSVLVLDETTGAFTRYEIARQQDTNYRVVGAVPAKREEGDDTSHYILAQDVTSNKYKLARFDPSAADYLDFGAKEMPAYILTGWETVGDARRHRQTQYVGIYTENDPTGQRPHGCLVSGRWDFSVDSATGKFSTKQQAVRTRRGYSTSVAKLLIRGRGRALALRFEAEAGKPCGIEGWTATYEAGARP